MAQPRKPKVPPTTPETFLALELAYGSDPTMKQLCTFCGYPEMYLTHENVGEALMGIDPSPRTKSTTAEQLVVSLWVGAYIKWKKPHEFAALDDLHLDKPSKYNPLA